MADVINHKHVSGLVTARLDLYPIQEREKSIFVAKYFDYGTVSGNWVFLKLKYSKVRI